MNGSTILGKVHGRWQRALHRHRSIAELAGCPPSQLHRIAQDVGLSDGALKSFACSHAGPSELMPKRLQELGLDPAYFRYARTAAYRDMERVCSACKSWRRCARDLAKGEVQAGMRGYCLNAATIDALTIDRMEETPGERWLEPATT
jgi:hypothetical protein